MRKLILALCGAAMLGVSPAVAADGTVCIRHNDIYNWTALNDKTLVLENFRHQKALVKLIGTCSNFRFHETIAIRSAGGTDLSCVEAGDTVITRDLGMTGRCAVVSVAPYTGPAKQPDAKPDAASSDHGNGS
ncbi:MAG: DUF6491 family protein [Rhizomicrobium sp.]